MVARSRERPGTYGALDEARRLWPFVRPHGGLLSLTLTTTILLAVIDIPIPFFLQHLIDAVLRGTAPPPLLGRHLEPSPFLAVLFAGMVTLAVGKGLLLYGQRVASDRMGQRLVHALRLDLYRHLHALSMPFFRNARTGKLMLRLIGDINAVLDLIRDGALRALTSLLTVMAVCAVILLLEFRLALVVLSVLPFYVFTFARLSPQLRRVGRKVRRERSMLSGDVQEKIAGAAVVKAFHREESEIAAFAARTAHLRDWLVRKAQVGGRLNAFAATAVAVGGALVLWVGAGMVLDGRLTPGQLMAFYTLAAMLFPPLRRLARTNETYQASRVSLQRVFEFFDTTTPLKEKSGAAELRVSRGAVRLEGVGFSYTPGVPVLRDINFEVAGGEVVALVGPNGAGKTTLVSLLPRFIDPDEGRVLIDGQNLHEVTLASLRRQIGLVTQETFLFSGTIEDNIRYGRPEATREEVWEAARVANADDFIRTLPKGLRTQVGERGQRLSGGERQRIALARMVINNPPVLVLDEATSAVDAESETLIREALLRLMHGRTTFVIAHRIGTVRRADRILVMDQGRIVEDGTHATLFPRNGLYTRICQEQLLADQVAP